MKATLECPKCGHKDKKFMPEDSCMYFYRCTGCEKIIRTEGTRCVFCAYSDKQCPAGCSAEG